MTDYQEKILQTAVDYATEVALKTPFMRMSFLDVLDKFREELCNAFIAGVAHGTDKNFIDTQRLQVKQRDAAQQAMARK